MVTQPDNANNGVQETLTPDTPDRGEADDAFFQSFIDAAADEDDADAPVEAIEPSTEAPTAVAEPPVPAPAPEATPLPTAPNIPNEVDTLRQQNAQFQQQLQQQAVEQQRVQLEQETAQSAQQLQEQGLMPEQATYIANQQRQMREREIGAQQQLYSQAAYMQGKMNAALYYSEQHGVSAQELLQYDNPQAMELAALQKSEIKGLKDKVANLQKSGVPAQTMDSNTASPAMGTSQERLVDSALNKAPGERTQAEQEALARMAGG